MVIMNAYVSREELALLPANRMSYPEHYADAQSARRNPIARLVARVRGFVQRQQVLAELNQLSDRELADIGLNRMQLSRVFDPAFGYSRR